MLLDFFMRRTARRSLLLCTIIGLGIPAAGAQSTPRPDPLAGFDAYVAKGVADWQVPGMAIAVVKDDSVVFIKGYGVKTLGGHDSVNIHTLFANASTTKAFTSFAVMMMQDSGKLSLDAHVADRLPEFQLQPAYVSQEITVRDLLTHRSGLPEAGYLWYGTTYTFPDIAKKMRLVKPSHSFRSHFEYENVTYAAAGFIAADADKTDWESMYKSHIFTPLGMNETFTGTNAAVAHGNIATPHFRIDDTVRAIDRYPTDNIGPAGSMYSSVSDMTKWLRFLLDSTRLGGKRVLSAGSFAELWQPQMLVGSDEFYPTARLTHPNYTAYGLGWFLEDYRGEAVVFHTGSIDGFVAIVGLIPSRKLGVVIFENLDHAELRHALMYTVFDRYIGGGTHDWSAEMRKMYDGFRAQRTQAVAAAEKKRVMGTKPSLPVAAYAGTYKDELYGTVVIRLKDGKLWSDDPFAPADLEHWNYDTFQMKYRKAWLGKQLVTFQLGTDGKVAAIDAGDGVLFAKQPESAAK